MRKYEFAEVVMNKSRRSCHDEGRKSKEGLSHVFAFVMSF